VGEKRGGQNAAFFFLISRHHLERLLRNHGDPILVDLDLLD
jgi:hypothetical protein